MARKYELITELYHQTLKEITSSQGAWRAFLRSACRNYKCRFDEQVLIYAQRPDARAVLELEDWNKKLGRWVNRGAAGIAVFDDTHTGNSRLKHYFDISDTHAGRFSRPVPVWEMQERYVGEVIEALEASFGAVQDNGSLESTLMQLVHNVVEDNEQDYLRELMYCRENSYLEDLDEFNVEVYFRQLLQASVSYMLLERCMGSAADQYAKLVDFSSLFNFNTRETVNALGIATSDMAEMVLREIALTVRNIQKRERQQNRTVDKPQEAGYPVNEQGTSEPERSFEYESDIPQRGRLQSAQPSASAGDGSTPWEVRVDAQEVSQGEPQSDLHEPSDIGQAEQPPDGDRADGAYEAGTDGAADGEGRERDGGTESHRSDEMGGPDEQHPALGRGRDTERTDLQLNTESPEEADSDELPAFLDDTLIMGIIANKDDELKYKKQQIELFFSIHPDESERAEYIQSAYLDRSTEILVDGKCVGFKPQGAGLLMWEGVYLSRSSEAVFSWQTVAAWTAQLIEKKEYYINRDIKALKSQASQQMSLFDLYPAENDTPYEQVSLAGAFAIPQSVIDEALCLGGNEPYCLERICAWFSKDYPLEQNAAFLREEYGTSGKGFFSGVSPYALWFDESGIRIGMGRTAQSATTLIAWEDAAKRIRELLDTGRYVPQSVLDNAPGNERKELAEHLWYTVQDFSREAHDENLIPTILAIYNTHGGFPDNTAQIRELLKNSETVSALITEVEAFAVRYTENPDLMRFRFRRHDEILTGLHGLLRAHIEFSANLDFSLEPKQFITNDEIDRLLTGGSNVQHSKFRIYSYFLEGHTPKERADFLKHEYGSGGGGRLGFDEWHDSKGITYKRENAQFIPYDTILLKWPQVEQRVSELIRQGKYMSEKELAYIPTYEKHELAREIQGFFSGLPQETPRPFPYGFDFYEAVKLIEPQLDDPARVEEIHRMMLPVWESTAQDDRHYDFQKRAFKHMTAYLNGTFSLFSEKKEPAAIPEKAEEAPSPTPAQDVDLPSETEMPDYGEWEKGEDDEVTHVRIDLVPESQEIPAEKETVLAPPKPKRERVLFSTFHPEIPAEQRYNFRITDPQLGVGTPSERFAANAAAIRTLKRIEDEDRLATPEEQETLSRYVGWGGLADCFDDRHGRYLELKSLLDEDEYAAARASSLTAFYTPPVIVEAMYKALSQMGFQTGNILEPACGVGNFIGMIPDSMADSKAYGVEIDSISGRIARQLYQNSSVAVNGFEKVDMPDSFFDVAIGNVPFGDFKVLDRRYDKHKWLIHDYFFGKALDKVRPGGIVAFISSKGTMDKENSAVRKYLAQRADLIGAIRLPDNAFKRNAGTDVTSDIIFLQKRDRMTDIEPDWVHLDTDENGIRMNIYFAAHPDMILGEMVMESTAFGMDSACKPYEGASLSEQLSEAVSNLHAEITEYEADELEGDEDLSISADPSVRNFSYTIVDGKTYFRENSRMHPVELSVTAENRIRGMIVLRDCTRQLMAYQTEDYPEDMIQQEQARLGRLYDDYTRKYGLLCSRGNSLAFGEDSSYCLLCSLEVLDEEGNFLRKADMFTKRTIRPHVPVTSVDTASEALAVSISEKARVDMAYMAQLSGKSEAELETELTGVIFRDINCATDPDLIPKAFVDLEKFPFVTADEYLSGNVRKKLQMLRALETVLPAEEKNRLQTSITAMEAVQPDDLTAAEIGVRIGATWIPPEIYKQFMFELFSTGGSARHRMNVLYSKYTGEWNITDKNSDLGNIKAVTTYGTKRISAYHIFEQTLNLKDVRIFDTIIEDGNEKRVLNKRETAIAQDRQELIKSKFSEWLWKDIDRREMLCRIYNDTFNSIRPREYDGQHINFSGMTPEITLRGHQINAIAHVMYGGNTLLAHEVGAGKSATRS